MKQLSAAAEKSALEFAVSQFGKTLPVIFENVRNNLLHGWSDNYLPVALPPGIHSPGKIVMVNYDKNSLNSDLKNHLSGGIL